MESVTLSSDLARAGFTYAEMARTSRAGQLQRIRRGAYVVPSAQPQEARDVHRRLIEATVRQGSAEAVVSHMSAAVLHDLPIWTDSLSRVHVSRDRDHGGKVRRYVHLHATPLAEDELTEIDGLRVTTMARTVVDLGRSLTQLRSVPIGDAALAQGLSIDELERAVARAAGRSGIGAARRMAAFCDGRSESVGESTSRVVLSQVGIPAPRLQYEVLSATGELVGRSDFCWEEMRTLGEFDGKIKYGRLLKPGQNPSDVVFAEKLREDALRDLGWQVVRWIWEDLARPRALAERLERAFARSRGSR